MIEQVAVIIPSLNPDEKLVSVVNGALEKGFQKIILINDGSDEKHLGPFKEAETHPECVVLTHEVNQGKGRGMKTAFRYVLDECPEIKGVIVVDGDNQHTPKDIVACSERMLELGDKIVIGCRDFNAKDIPARSRFGNKMTRVVLRYACSVRISDTQTGLRAIPREYLEDMIAVKGERYEYETNQLLSFRELGIEFVEVPIDTVYINDNESSHFHPIRDSFKIYSVILKFMSTSIISFLIDLGMYSLALFFLQGMESSKLAILIATVFARLISSLVNFWLNKKVVFKAKGNTGGSLARYYALVVVQMLLSACGVNGLVALFSWGKGLSVVAKIIVDTILYFVSFYFQRTWVFKRSKKK